MKIIRVVLIVLGGIVVLLAVAIGLAFVPRIQTWAARKAAEPQGVSIGHVAVDLHSVEAKDVRVEQPGLKFVLPAAQADLPVRSALKDRIEIGRLVAKGWKLDLTGAAPPVPAPSPAATSPAAGPASPSPANPPPPKPVLQSLFDLLQLPVDVALGTVDLEGDISFRPQPGAAPSKVHLIVTGGDLKAGGDGVFTVTADVVSDDPSLPVSGMKATAKITVGMATPRSLDRLLTEIDLVARGEAIPNGATLHAEVSARKDGAAEHYTLGLKSDGRDLIAFSGELPPGDAGFSGKWSVDLADADLSPFALGRPLPAFAIKGGGGVSGDRALSEMRLDGELDLKTSHLDVVLPELAVLGEIQVHAAFDIAQSGREVQVSRLGFDVAGEHPVFSINALQPVRYDAAAGTFSVADAGADLARVELKGMPLAWAQAFLPDVQLEGGAVTGALVAAVREGGVSVRVISPIALTLKSIGQGGAALVSDVALQLSGGTAAYSPSGWQADLGELRLSPADGGTPLLVLNARAGRSASVGPAIKAQGKWQADLPALLRQPILAGYPEVGAGGISGNFTASLAETQSVQIDLLVDDVALATGERLPKLAAQIRADHDAAGKISWHAPITLTNAQAGDRQSDLTVDGDFQPGTPDSRLNAEITSALVYLEDLKLLGAPATRANAAPVNGGGEPDGPVADPPWKGLSGSVKIGLKRVVYSGDLELTDINGSIALSPGAFTVEGFQALLKNGGAFKAAGGLTFDAARTDRYGLKADVNVTNFDPAPVFRAAQPDVAPPVEGKFDVSGSITGAAPRLDTLTDTVAGDLKLTSRGGTLSALGVSVQAPARAAGMLGTAASYIGRLTGHDAIAERADQAQAVAQVAQTLGHIEFDQLNIEVARAIGENYTIRDLTLIAPSVRLSGAGSLQYQPGVAIVNLPLKLDLQLAAHDQFAAALKTLGLAADEPDSLGYFPMKQTVQLDGSLEKIGTAKLSSLIMNQLAK